MQFHKNILDIQNTGSVETELQNFIKDQIFDKFKRKGAVIGISGGIDSALTCTLCARAIGKDNVLGVLMPEKDSNPKSAIYARNLCERLGVRFVTIDITDILDSFNVYNTREQIIKKYFPNFTNQDRFRIVVPDRLVNSSSISLPHLEILDTKNQTHKIIF